MADFLDSEAEESEEEDLDDMTRMNKLTKKVDSSEDDEEGLPEEWQTFYESYESTTQEFDYSSLHNIMRLREAIQGKARETVELLLCSSRNVEAIISTLKETYGRPEQLIKSQIEKVRALPFVNENNIPALITFANQINNMATFIEAANGMPHLANPMLLSELIAKLPPSRQMQWAEKCLQLEAAPTVLDFSKWLCGIRKLANMVADSLPSTSAAAITSVQHARRHQPSVSSDNKGRKFVCVSIAKKCQICDGECQSLVHCNSFIALSVDERWKNVKAIHACFSCLKRGHQANKCFSRRKGGTSGCPHFHHRLLHNTMSDPVEACISAAAPIQPVSDRRSCHAESNREDDSVLFQIIPVKLYNKAKVVQIHAFIDDGANATMLDADVARKLGVNGQKDTLELQWLNKQTSREDVEIVELSISGVERNAEIFQMTKVFISKNLQLPDQEFDYNKFVSQNNNVHLAGLPITSYPVTQPKMVISLTHAFLTVPVEVPRSWPRPGPIAVKTRLGWLVYGPIDVKNSCKKLTSCHFRQKQREKENFNAIEELMRNYFDMETLGIRVDIKPLRSESEKRAVSILEATTKRDGQRYESGLLWRDDKVTFPESYDMALNRLENLERKLEHDPELATQYIAKIDEYVKKGYARRLSDKEAQVRTVRTFYLPHFAVKNPNKKGIRLVFDAAAKTKGVSLNTNLLPGPDLNQPLLSILFKFRQAPIAICGDIREMFHQVRIVKADQDAQRFLWRNGNRSQQPETFVMERMIFGASCSPTTAQYIKNLNAEQFTKNYTRAVKGILDRHYVDDYVDCFQSEQEAIQVVRDIIMIHKNAGFEMRNIVSNSEAVMREVGNCKTTECMSVEGGRIERILGMHWLPDKDQFSFIFKFNKVSPEILSMKKKPTKREMLSLTMSVFDPFGLLQNFTVCSKILMQAVWKSGIQWDEQVPDTIFEKWKSWLQELPKVEKFRMIRCYFSMFENEVIDLHIFCDASEEAVAAVAYWRYRRPHGVHLAFVAAKTSCAPTRFHSIPKLELQAAVVAVRLKDTILKYHEAKVQHCKFWTDSYTVIRWIRSDHRSYKQYVANRVAEVLESSKIEDWRWCPGELNPADEATRAKFPVRFNPESRWKNGPEFLLKSESEWPTEAKMNLIDRSADEIKSKYVAALARQVKNIVPNINSFSSFSKLRRTMAWVLRYVSNLARRTKKQPTILSELSSEEEGEAEYHMWRWLQHESFMSEILDIERTGAVAKSSDLKSLNPLMDEKGVLRVKGRLENAEFIPLSARRPIILPRNHQLTRLLEESFHQKLRHINTDTVICEIRQKYWITAIRSLVRSVEARCNFCRLRKAKPVTPQMGSLPPDRVTPYIRPFTYTGLDYFGPVNVSIGRRREKRWVALFTCLTVRALHLEIAADLSSDSCLVCIKNFVNRRGIPLQIRSDNGTNFVGISKELQGTTDFMDNDKILAGLSPLGIQWKYNTPSNPSAGGAWERLVRSVKNALSIMLVEHAPRLETLHSFLIEAENIINSRPLTHLPVTPDEPDPLTPNHFLLGYTNSTQVPAPFEPKLLCLRKQWRLLQNLKNGFWKQWLQMYLPELTRRTKWCLPKNPIAVGSLVLVCDDNAPRSQWKRGRILNLYIDKEGVARSADVKTSSGAIKRPLSKLAVLDVEQSSKSTSCVNGGEPPPPG